MVYRGTVEGLKHKKLNSVGNGESRHVRGRSTTLRNMAFVTIRKLPNGVVKITGRKMAGNPGRRKARNSRAPRNGYVVYPGSVGFMSLARANKEAKEQSSDGKARVENVDTQKVVSRWSYGRKER
jgi:hypothetical protein